MTPINERIAECVKASGLTKTAFAERINVTQQFVSNLCLGKTNPSDRTIADICREFGVSEAWLRDGVGEMYVNLTRDEQIAGFVGKMLSSSKADFRSALIAALSKLDENEWAALESITLKFVEAVQKDQAVKEDKKEAGP